MRRCEVLQRRTSSPARGVRTAGQATTEFLMMTAVVVGIVLIVGAGLKHFMPELVGNIAGMVANGFEGRGGGGSGGGHGSGGKSGSKGACGGKGATSGYVRGVGFGQTCDEDIALDMTVPNVMTNTAGFFGLTHMLPEIKK